MKPILLELGPFRIHAYGLGLAVSFLVGSWLVTRRGRRLGYAEDDLMRLFWWILVSSLIGSRLYYALQHPQDFADNWLGVSQIWRGGLTQYGGLIGALIVGGLFIRSQRWSFRRVSDLIAPALALGEGLTRIGCFYNGCCFGKVCGLPWAVRFPPGSHAHAVLGPQSVHPSQLYLSLSNLMLFVLLLPLGERLRRPGRLFAVYLAASSVLRFLVDFTRFYEAGDRITIAGAHLAHSQWVSIALLVVAAVFWFHAPRRDEDAARAETGASPA
jgi:phosphatidylglycerol---prolipoprotein diacylglyceryl transferase